MNGLLETKRLHELGEQKLHLLRAARELSLQQIEVLQGDDTTTLLSILSRKSEILDSLGTLQQALDPYKNQHPDERIWESPEQRTECRQVFADIDQLLQELSRIDQCSLDQMTLQRDAMANQIAQFTTAEVVQNAYSSSFLDSDNDASASFSLEG